VDPVSAERLIGPLLGDILVVILVGCAGAWAGAAAYGWWRRVAAPQAADPEDDCGLRQDLDCQPEACAGCVHGCDMSA